MKPPGFQVQERKLAAGAAELIRDPERHTTKADAIDKDGNNVAGATKAAGAEHSTPHGEALTILEALDG